MRTPGFGCSVGPRHQKGGCTPPIDRRSFLTAAAALLAAPGARAQAPFPSKPIRMLVGFAPGGATDTAARLIGEHISKLAGQPVLVDNRPGAGGIVAATAVAKAPPDGRTLILNTSYPFVSAQGLLSSLPYDANKDFAMVTPVMGGSVLMCVHRSVPMANLREFVAHAKKTPKFAIGSWAPGSQGHLLVDALNRHYGLAITHVAYKGEGPMTQDVLGGQIAGGTGSLFSMIGGVKSGNLKPIAVTNGPRGTRNPMLPEVATFQEQGFDDPSVTLSGWIGIVTTAGTPAPIVARLNEWIRAALAQPEIHSKLETFGLEVVSQSPAEFEASFRAEVPKWVKMIRDAGVKLD
ncbi:MAG: tripartite tricarboxylate transporter substrate binding protein [Betaproteobacteria bacterium]|nr:tripartite tricarboxylate transporter substrate binding protein [Betaproteobacteria bacterium]